MSNRPPTQRLRPTILAIVVLVGACSSDRATVEIASEGGTEATSTTVAIESSSTTDQRANSTTTPPTSLEPVTTTTAAPITTTTTTPPDLYAGYDVEVVSDFATGSAEFVRLTPSDAPDQECSQGILAVQLDSEIIHTYDELGTVGGLRAFYGPRAQFAMVENCEEWTSRIHFSDFGLPPADDVPRLVSSVPPENVFFLHEFGWFGLSGMFMAEASFYEGEGEGWTDAVVFTTHDGNMRTTSEVIGWREPILAAGIDYVGPAGWSVPVFDPDATSIGMTDFENGSSLLITVRDGPIEVPAAEAGETPRAPTVFEVDTWETVDEELGRSRKIGRAAATETFFLSDDGERTVRQIEIDDRTIEIELFVSSTIGAPYIDIPWAAMDAVRVYESVG